MASKTKLGKFLAKIWEGIERVFGSIGKEARKIINVSYDVVENIKKFVDSPTVDIITALIPGNLDNEIVAKLRIILPQVLAILSGLKKEDAESMSEAELKAVVVNINSLDKDAKKIFYHGIGSLLTEKLTKDTDNEISWSDSVALQEYHKKNEAA